MSSPTNVNLEPTPESELVDSTDDTEQGKVIALADFVDEFGEDLLNAVKRQNPPVYDGVPDIGRTAVMEGMKKKPFAAQQAIVQATSRLLIDHGSCAAIINGEMGTGKTLMSIAVTAAMHNEGYGRFLILSPPHLVRKWGREITESVPNAKVWTLNGPDTLAKLIYLRSQLNVEHTGPEYFVLGRVRMRMGFNWAPAFWRRKVHSLINANIVDSETPARTSTVEYVACASCGELQYDSTGEQVVRVVDYAPERRTNCHSCETPLWQLNRGKQEPMSKLKSITKALCKLPTIGPKTAAKLIAVFGDDFIEQTLSDNIYDLINLMDKDGELIFGDRRALRLEKALSNMELEFGQGGYQPTEFIKRYLPKGFFDLLCIDECHEYKGHDSCQGEAMGVLSNKIGKTLLLTGSLSGGYATDLFYLLWRVIGNQLREDGYVCNERGSMGPAAMSFMQDYGVLKDVFKETIGPSHKTARGNKVSARTSKAPGFSPKALSRYILPYTAFLKLRDLGEGNLPRYTEQLIEVELEPEQQSVYDDMSAGLSAELRKALACGDNTLMGVVINACLRWPETMFRPEVVKHPRRGDVLHHNDPCVSGDEVTTKEASMVELCLQQKARGRRVLLYTIYTGTRDIATRLNTILTKAGLKAAVLRSTVSPEQREDWIMAQVDRGIDVLICNPELVKTGLDLYDFPTLGFLQSGTNVYTLLQASRRSWRIGQREDVEVYFWGYRNTQQVNCLRLMSQKLAVTMSISGDMPDSGLDSLSIESDSIEVELARQLAA